MDFCDYGFAKPSIYCQKARDASIINLLLILVLPPWFLNSTFRRAPLICTFYVLDYFLIPTVIPLSFLSSLYQQYKSKTTPSIPKTRV
ncbi:unnamed protein product [Caenorhabditis auriculariae]|uniref:Uncharacterized protein n=1 Tax=Caenorhabditis auriculariae TaxID=2777116 RepID=A0A8S1HYE5_9PELO|nr:unnamed protein product [Caenorhabditis auriculariae]